MDAVTPGADRAAEELQPDRIMAICGRYANPKCCALLVIESLIDGAHRENTFGLTKSLNMLIEFGDAFDYTAAGFR